MEWEWTKDKTLKLIELLQVNASLWNPSLCDTRREKQKRKEELRAIADILGISVPDTTKKIQHLRTQYNRESAKEARVNAENPNDRYVSNCYAYEYLHFMKDSSKVYKILQSVELSDNIASQNETTAALTDCKLFNLSPPHKVARTEVLHPVKSEIIHQSSPRDRDEFSVFGEYIANELRSLKGEKNLLVAKKKIQDVIFEVKMGMMSEGRVEQTSTCNAFTHASQASSLHTSKLYTAPVMSAPPTTGINEIIINGPCHYSNFKVDTQ
ncbi:hypothetical protein RR46_06045 [Papilio xuthus]|uniref:MADF domain-containing protein n=1 Tax=Papilio xuthus TaxID=66420 RepID=A0A194Q8M3_PAPXU|nr:hypothetical protein RR46_06045 [Papilio xuthus]